MNTNDGDAYPNAKRQRKEGAGNYNPKPSFVVHARNLVDGISEELVHQTLEKYGEIVDIYMLPKKRQALIQYEEIESAMTAVEDSNEKGIFINNLQCYLNFSTGQKIMRPSDFEEKKVLSINVVNPLYPITINVLQQILEPFGKVARIVIFRKSGVQVMVEYESGDAANKAKEELEGADIYSGCCTLSIDFAKVNRLAINNNETEGYDFTNDNENDNNSNGFRAGGGRTNISSLMSLTESNFQPSEQTQQGHSNAIVVNCHNLCPDHFNCDKLFNMLSLYGNIDKIKFLLSKEGSAMLQMSNAKPLFDSLPQLNNLYLFGRKINVHVGKQTVLQPVAKPINLKDETTSYKEYMNCRNNRYQTPEAASKNKPLPPSNVLYWYNAPPGVAEEQIVDIFEGAGAMLPAKVKIFPKKIDKSSTGLVEWSNISDSVEALVLTNHTEINHPSSKFPYIFKLCFSGTPISRIENNNYNNRQGAEHDNYDDNEQDDANEYS